MAFPTWQNKIRNRDNPAAGASAPISAGSVSDGGAIPACSEGLSEATPLVSHAKTPRHAPASRSDASTGSPAAPHVSKCYVIPLPAMTKVRNHTPETPALASLRDACTGRAGTPHERGVSLRSTTSLHAAMAPPSRYAHFVWQNTSGHHVQSNQVENTDRD